MYLKWLASNKIYILNIFSNIYSNTDPKPCLQSYTQCLELFLFQWECCINLIGLLQCRLSGSFTIQFIHLSFQIKDFFSSIYFYHTLVECMPEILLMYTALIGDNYLTCIWIYKGSCFHQHCGMTLTWHKCKSHRHIPKCCFDIVKYNYYTVSICNNSHSWKR